LLLFRLVQSTRLSNRSLSSLRGDIARPRYDRGSVAPGIVHVGVGNFHRSHQAVYVEEAMQASGSLDWGIQGAGILPSDAPLLRALNEQDDLYTLLERSDEKVEARVVGSLTPPLLGPEDPESIFDAFARASTRIVSLTVTEGGYCVAESTGTLDFEHPGVAHDLSRPNERPETVYGYLAAGLERRWRRGVGPVTVLSCDNLTQNGRVVARALLAFAGARSPELGRWIGDHVAFPSSMVDRITPVTSEEDRKLLRSTYGVDDACLVTCEPYRQWVIEDTFAAGRPELELAGVQFTSDVAPYQNVKIRLLNATHSAMGYLGYLCGYRYVHEVATAPEFASYLTGLMDDEVTPLLAPLPGLELGPYKRTIMTRFANRAIVDTLLRICSDGSAKIPKFILPSIADELARNGPIDKLALCVASWLRFLDGVDEAGAPIPLQDKGAEKLAAVVRRSKADPRPALELREIFGELGSSERFVSTLGQKLESLYSRGARATLAAT
jgi:mannitol 2-dehydrogenase